MEVPNFGDRVEVCVDLGAGLGGGRGAKPSTDVSHADGRSLVGSAEARNRPILVRKFEVAEKGMRQIGGDEVLSTDGSSTKNAAFRDSAETVAVRATALPMGAEAPAVPKVIPPPAPPVVVLAPPTPAPVVVPDASTTVVVPGPATQPSAVPLRQVYQQPSEEFQGAMARPVAAAPVARRKVILSGPAMGRHTLFVRDVIVNDRLLILVYPTDGSAAIVEPPATGEDLVPLVVEYGGQKHECVCREFAFERGDELFLVLLRV